MNSLCIFFNTRVEGSGALAWIGDKGLLPFRYLFNGNTIYIERRVVGQEIEIQRIPSFSKPSSWSYNKTLGANIGSSLIRMMKAAFAIVLLVPGLLFAAFKVLSFAFSDVREKHALIKEHLTPINRTIGSESNPIKSRDELRNAIRMERDSDPKNHLTNALIIHGDGSLTINEDPGILDFNPMKLILVGACIVHEPSNSFSGPLDEQMNNTDKWEVAPAGIVTSNLDNSFAGEHKVNSIDEALQAIAPRRSWISCKRYHQIFTLARQQTI